MTITLGMEQDQENKELTHDQKLEISNYRPPKVRKGQQVVFYPRGVRNKGEEALGWVWDNRNRRNISVYVPHTGGENIHTGVFFIEDPRLQQGPEVRENGAWDFSEEYQADHEWKEGIEKRLRAVELASISKGGHDRDVLFNIADRLGLKIPRKLKSDVIRERIFETIKSELDLMTEAAGEIEDRVSDPPPEEFDASKVAKDLDY